MAESGTSGSRKKTVQQQRKEQNRKSPLDISSIPQATRQQFEEALSKRKKKF